jgi:SAM-dependent methyltransferase
MKIGIIPETMIERVGLAVGVAPTPLLDTFGSILLARTIMTATRLDIFETLEAGPLTADEVARRGRTDPFATGKLLVALAGTDYLKYDNQRYSLAPVVRKWLLKSSKGSMRDAMLFRYFIWERVGHYEDYIRTGEPIGMHEEGHLSPEQWEEYQLAMRATANLSVPEVTRRLPVPRGARLMLDIGGSHGYYAVALCRRHRGLRAIILELPEAIESAAPILAKEGMGDRVVHQIGNALTDDLGEAKYDVVLISNLVHAFEEEQNLDLQRRVARALRPGGYVVIQEPIRPGSPKEGGQFGALADLYWALGNKSGTWSYAEIASWQRAAGLTPLKPIQLRTAPGIGLQAAQKPAG